MAENIFQALGGTPRAIKPLKLPKTSSPKTNFTSLEAKDQLGIDIPEGARVDVVWADDGTASSYEIRTAEGFRYNSADQTYRAPGGDIYNPDEYEQAAIPEIEVNIPENWTMQEGQIVSPSGWKVTDAGYFVSPEGTTYSQTAMERHLQDRDLPGIEDFFTSGGLPSQVPTAEPLTNEWYLRRAFRGMDTTAVVQMAQTQPDKFIDTVRSYARTPDAEAFVRSIFPDATEGDLGVIFGSVPIQAGLYYSPLDEQVATVFPIINPEVMVNMATKTPDVFVEEVAKRGWNADTERLIREVRPNITEPELEQLFGMKASEATHRDLTYAQYQVEDAWDDVNHWGWLKNWAANYGDILSTTGGVFSFLGMDDQAEWANKWGANLQAGATPSTTGELDWGDLLDPNFYETKVSRLMPTALLFAAAGIMGAYGGGAIAGALGVGKIATYLFAAFVSTAMSRPLESAMEAGEAYNQALYMGKSKEEAKKAFSEVFTKNMTLSGMDAAQIAIALAPTPKWIPASLVKNGLARVVSASGKMVIVGLTEGGEEIYQDIIQRQARGETWKWDAQSKEVFALGAFMGIGMGLGGDVISPVLVKFEKKLNPDLKAQFDERVAKLIEQKATETQAKTQAMGELVESNEELKEIARQSIEETKTENDKIEETIQRGEMPLYEQIRILATAGEGQPGVRFETVGIVYRNEQGQPQAIITLHGESSGAVRIGSVVRSKDIPNNLLGSVSRQMVRELRSVPNLVMPSESEMSELGYKAYKKYMRMFGIRSDPTGSTQTFSRYTEASGKTTGPPAVSPIQPQPVTTQQISKPKKYARGNSNPIRQGVKTIVESRFDGTGARSREEVSGLRVRLNPDGTIRVNEYGVAQVVDDYGKLQYYVQKSEAERLLKWGLEEKDTLPSIEEELAMPEKKATPGAPSEPVITADTSQVVARPDTPIGKLEATQKEIRSDIEAVRESMRGKKDINSRLTRLIFNDTERQLNEADTLIKRIEKKQEVSEEEINTLQEKLTQTREAFKTKRQTEAQVKQQLVNYINDNLKAEDKGKLLAAVKNAKTDSDLNEAIARVEEIAEKQEQKRLISKIEETIKKAKPKKQGGILKGKFTFDVQEELDIIKQNLHADRDAARGKIAENIARMQDGTLDSEEGYRQNARLNVAGIDGMSSEELANTLDYIRDLENIGRAERFEKKAREKAYLDDIKEQVFDDVAGGEGLKPGVESLAAEAAPKPSTLFEKLVNRQYSWADMLDKLSKLKKGLPFKSNLSKFGQKVSIARDAENAAVQKIFSDIQANALRIFNVKTNRQLQRILNSMRNEEIDIGTFLNTDGKPVSLRMTKGQIIKKYQETLDPTLDRTFAEGMRWTPEMKAAMSKWLTPQEKAWADYQMEFYQTYYDSINAVYREMFGVDLPHNYNYSPLSRDFDVAVQEEQLVYQDIARYASALNGSLKSRTENINPLKPTDANLTFTHHIIQMEHFKAWAKTVHELRVVLGDKNIRQAILQYHGADILKEVSSYLNDFARGGADTTHTIHLLDTIRANFARSVIGLKPGIALQQIPTTWAYLTEMKLNDFMSGIADFWKNPVEHFKWMMENVPYIKERYKSGFERDIQFAKSQNKLSRVSGLDSIKDSSFALMQMGDQFAVLQGWWAKYREGLKKGLTQETAILEANETTDRTQNTASIDTLSSLQRGGSWWKLLTMFQNQPNKYFRMIGNNMRNLKYGRGSRGKALSNIIIAWVILPGLFQLIANGFQWRKEEQLRALAFGPINDLLVLGQLARSVADWITGETFEWQASPALSTVQDIQNSIQKIRSLVDDIGNPYEDISSEDVWSLVESLAKPIGGLAGIPTPYMIQVERAIRAGDLRQLIFSRWALREASPDDNTKVSTAIGKLGSIMESDVNAELSEKPLPVFDMSKLNSEMNSIFDSVLPSDILKMKDADPYALSWAEKELSKSTYLSLPNTKLNKINTESGEDTIVEYYQQWQARQKIDSLEQLREFDNLYPNAYLGNVDRSTYDLLVKYKNMTPEERGKFLEEHPELNLDPRDEWLKAHHEDNAKLAIWGDAKIMTSEAYEYAKKYIAGLKIPADALDKIIPNERIAEPYYKYNDTIAQWGANSAEAKLILIDTPELVEFLEREPITDNKKSLELKVKWREIQDKYDSYSDNESTAYLPSISNKADPDYKTGREYAREQLRTDNPEYVDDLVRMEALDKGASDDIAELLVDYRNEPEGNSQQLFRQENPELDAFGQENLGWQPITDSIEENRLAVKFRPNEIEYSAFSDKESESFIEDEHERSVARNEYLKKNPEYNDYRIMQSGYSLGISDDTVSGKWLEYYKLPESGYWRKRYLANNPDFLKEVNDTKRAKGETVWEIPDKIPAQRYDDLTLEWEEQFYAYDHVEGTSTERMLERDKILKENPGFEVARIERQAYEYFMPEEYVKDWVNYYTLKETGYDRDRYLKAHPEFYKVIKENREWTRVIDFKKIPSVEVEKLYAEYQKLPTGKPRQLFRRENPDFDEWYMYTYGVKSLPLDLGEEEEEDSPFSERAQDLQDYLS